MHKIKKIKLVILNNGSVLVNFYKDRTKNQYEPSVYIP